MQHRDLPDTANEITTAQGWDLESLTTHLISFIQTNGPIEWETRLTEHFSTIADEENQEDAQTSPAQTHVNNEVPSSGVDLDTALECWQVHEPGMWENDTGPEGWTAVSNDDGITAYFGDPADAYRHRFAMINRDMNP